MLKLFSKFYLLYKRHSSISRNAAANIINKNKKLFNFSYIFYILTFIYNCIIIINKIFYQISTIN